MRDCMLESLAVCCAVIQVGVEITLPAFATGNAIANIGNRGMSLIDVSITCERSGGQTAINTTQSTYGRDLYGALTPFGISMRFALHCATADPSYGSAVVCACESAS